MGLVEMYTSQVDLSNGIPSEPKKNHMQKLQPRELNIPTNLIGATNLFFISPPRVKCLDIYGFLIATLSVHPNSNLLVLILDGWKLHNFLSSNLIQSCCDFSDL